MDKVVQVLGIRIKFSVEFVRSPAGEIQGPPDEKPLRTITRTLTGRKPDMTTHFEIIGLESIRRRYDMHWQQIEEKVHLVVSHIIGAQMGAGDSFMKISPSKYALTFVRTDVKTAKRRAAIIRQQILDIFLSSELKNAQLDVRMEPPRATMPLQAPQPRPSMVAPAPPRPEASLEQMGMTPPAAPASNDLPDDVSGTRPMYFRVLPPKGGVPVERNQGPMRPVLLRDEEGNAVLPPGIRFLYRRIWDVASASDAGQRFFFHLTMPDGSDLSDYDVLPVDADDDMIAQLDLMMLDAVQNYLQQTQARGEPVKVICPVHYRSLATARLRTAYIDVCNHLPAELGGQYLQFEVLHMPRALYGTALTDPITALKKVSRGVILRCPLDHVAEDTLVSSGAMAVSTLCAHMDGRPQPAIERHFGNFVRSCNKLRMRSYAFGLDTPELCEAAEKAGFGGLCGDGVLTKYPDK